MESLKKQAARLLGEQTKYRRWIAIFLCLALVVTTGTVAALKMNGQALSHEEKVLTCGENVHQHVAECYGSDPVTGENKLVCGFADYIVHAHAESCYAEDGQLVCPLPETEVHVHGESCYQEQTTLICEKEETPIHQHTDACRALICQKEEVEAIPAHQHGETCRELSCGKEVSEGHQHTEGCYSAAQGALLCESTEEGHEHTAECYEQTQILSCELEETEAHAHSEECYGPYICGMEESEGAEGHTHTEECYDPYACGMDAEEEAHTHSEECYQVTKVLNCGKPQLHTHGAGCYDADGSLICGMPEIVQHVHSQECFEMDQVEPEEEPQLFQKLYEDTEIRVTAEYTEDAKIPEEAQLVAQRLDSGVQETEEVQSSETSEDTETPEEITYRLRLLAGDAETEPEDTVTFTAQGLDKDGNAAGAPVVLVYHAGDSLDTLLVKLAAIREGELSDDLTLSQTAETENYIVTVDYAESAEIPEEAQLQVIEYARDSEQYEQRCAQLGYQPDWLLNIGFFVGGEEVEPKTPVSVKVTEKGMTEAVNYEIVHFTDSQTEQIDGSGTQTENGVETAFMLNSFSDVAGFALQSVESGNQVGEVAPIGDLVHEKKVEPVTVTKTDSEGNTITVPGVYELTLNVKGSVAGGNEKAKLDIVFVMDTSGSMAWNVDGNNASNRNPSRRALANTAITRLIDDLDDSGIDAQYKLITFSSNANTTYAGNWQSGATLQNRLPGSASGGTNYEDALEKAGNAVAPLAHRPDSKTVVIFLTDGAPTYSKNGGNGSSTTKEMVTAAQRGAGNITCDYFFAVGFGAEMTKNTKVGSSGMTAYQILEAVANATNAKGKSASATTDLTSYFDSFKESLKRILATDVEFTDKLTNEVSIVDENGDPVENPTAGNWKVEIRDADNKALPIEHSEYTDAGMNVTYDSENGLKVSFKSGYILKQDYTYSVKTKIATNANAETKYANQGYMYTEMGDANTGVHSSNQQGIRCNVEGSAKVSYSYIVNGEKKQQDPTLSYPYPVVQLTRNLEPPAIVDQEMTHDKYIQKVEGKDDVYDLTLDLTGRVGSTTKPAYYDILFIVDESSSMSQTTRMTTEVVDKNNLICTKESHTHNNSCYEQTCTKEEHSHGIGCLFGCGKDAHTHNRSDCYKLLCEKHQHTDSCYGTKQETKNVQRTEAAKEAVKNLINSVKGNDKIIANYNLIGFGQNASSTGWLENSDTVMSKVNGLKTNSSYTNYGAALAEAKTQLDSAPEPSGASEDNRAVKFVIFLTDGVPAPSGTDNPSQAYYSSAITNAGRIQCDHFYAVGLGLDNKEYPITGSNPSVSKTPKQILEEVVAEVAAPVASKGVKEGKDGTELNRLFSDFAGILTELRCHDVTVRDTLSQYVEVNPVILDDKEIPAKLTIRVADFDGNNIVDSVTGDGTQGVSLILPPTEKNGLKDPEDTPAKRTIIASYNSDTREIVLDFPDSYKLESKYKYYVTVQIRPSKAAYEAAEALPKDAKGNVIYPNTGGAGTDGPGVTDKISEGKKGFFTNASATVTFRYDKDNTEEKETYERPVIKVNQAKLTIVKTVSGLTEEKTVELFANMCFIIDGDTQNPVTTSAFVSKTTDGTSYALKDSVEKTENADGTVTCKIVIPTDRELIPGKHKVTEVWEKAEVERYIRTTSYMVNGKTENGTEAEIEVEANETKTVEFSNYYTPSTVTIQLEKTDGEGNSENMFEGLQFSVRKGLLPVYTETITNPDDGTTETREIPIPEDKLQSEIDKLSEIAVFEIDKDGAAILKSVKSDSDCWKFNSDGIGKTEGLKLPAGDYTIIEVRTEKAPLTDYAEVYPFQIKVRSDGNVENGDILGYPNEKNVKMESLGSETYKLTVVNRKISQMKLRLQILKVSGQKDETVLEGAKFDLYQVTGDVENDENAIGTLVKAGLTSGSDGIVTDVCLTNLEAGGKYYLIETKAPAGYMLSDKRIRFNIIMERDPHEGNVVKVSLLEKGAAYLAYCQTEEEKVTYGNYDELSESEKNQITPYFIDDDGNQIWTLAVTNNTGAALPETGGPGTAMYTLGGLAILATSLVYGLSMRRRKERGGRN